MRQFLVALQIYCAMLVAAAAGPSMSSAWLKMNDIDQDKCMQHGKAVVQKNDFTLRFEVLGNSSIYGEQGDYTALLRCAADMNMVYFVVAGPKGDTASRYMNAMRDGFEASVSSGSPAASNSASQSAAPVAATDLAGTYRVEGTNPNGSTYRGEVTITADGELYNFRWRISNGDVFRGNGRLRNNFITVDWGQKYPVVYHVEDDGTLRGKWANGTASENLLPNR